MPVTLDQAKRAAQQLDTDAGRAVAADAELLGKLVDMLNGTLAAGEGRLGAVLGYIDKNAALCDIVVRDKDAKLIKASSASIQILTQTLSLMKLGTQASPGMVVATVGAMFTKKVALAMGMVENDKQAKLVAVLADMGAGVTTAGIALVTASSPMGWVLFLGALASAGIASYRAGVELAER